VDRPPPSPRFFTVLRVYQFVLLKHHSPITLPPAPTAGLCGVGAWVVHNGGSAVILLHPGCQKLVAEFLRRDAASAARLWGGVSGRSTVRPHFFWYAATVFAPGEGIAAQWRDGGGGGVTWRTGILKAKFTDFDVDVLVEFF
jgi:hypothetical protein